MHFSYADAHCDISDSILYAYPEKLHSFAQFRSASPTWLPHQVDLAGMQQANARFMVWSICPVDTATPEAIRISSRFEEFLRHVDVYQKLLTDYADHVTLVTSKAELIHTIDHTQKTAVLLHLEGMDCVKTIFDIQRIYEMGIRSFGLCGITSNLLAVSGTEHPGSPEGLSDFGKEIVTYLESLPVALDYAHLNDASFDDAQLISTKPVYVSHTACRHFCSDGQNMTNDQIDLIASRHGLMGIALFPLLLTGAQGTVADVVSHMRHVIDRVGPEVLCIGSDFDGMTPPPLQGVESMEKISVLENAFIDALGESITQKVFFTNLYRYFSHVLA